jgi:hypothetical protein
MPHALLEKAWELLEKEGLNGLTPERLAFYGEVPALQVYELYPTPLSILLGLWSFIETKAALIEPLPGSPKDNLFEQIMCVLEALQPYQLSVRRLCEDLMISPCWLKDLAPYGLKWSRKTLEEAGIQVKGIDGSLKVYVFAGFFLYILKIWTNDISPDHNLTMVKLDQGLAKLEFMC